MLEKGTTMNGVVYLRMPMGTTFPRRRTSGNIWVTEAGFRLLTQKPVCPNGKTEWGSAPRQRLPTRIRLNLSRGGYCKRLVSPWIIRSSTNFADKGTELYGVFSMNRMRSKTAFYVVQRI